MIQIEHTGWDDTAAQMLAPALRSDELFCMADLADEVQAGRLALFSVVVDGVQRGAYVLRVEPFKAGLEGVIVVGGGDLKPYGVNVMRQVLPVIEAQLSKCDTVRVHTARRGMVKLLEGRGYRMREIVLSKTIGGSHGRFQ